MTIGLFWGCFIPRRFPHLEKSVREVLNTLEWEYVDLQQMACCPDPLIENEIGHETYLTLAARNLARIQQYKVDSVLSVCNGCYHSLNYAVENLSEEKTRNKVNANLGEFRISVSDQFPMVKHFALEVHRNLPSLKEKVIKPLISFKAAVHHGCNMFTDEDRQKLPDPLHPRILHDCVRSVDATVVEYDLETSCCGNGLREFETEQGEEMALRKLLQMKESGANCVVVNCQSCYMQLETQQPLLEKKYGEIISLPVLYLAEVLALSFGFSSKELGLQMHRGSVDSLLEHHE